MHRRLFNAVTMIMGMFALLICVSAPANAQPMARHHDMNMSMAGETPDMPCCPEKAPAAYKACSLQCPIIAPAVFEFAVIVKTGLHKFSVRSSLFADITYDPLAPPPR